MYLPQNRWFEFQVEAIQSTRATQALKADRQASREQELFAPKSA